jgi:hypothetical protein
MSIHYMSRVLDLPLPPAEKLVLLAFADFADNTGYCFPSVPTVAVRASISVRGLQRIVSKLEAKGLLLRRPRYRRNGSQTSSDYIVLPELGGAKSSPAIGGLGSGDTGIRPSETSMGGAAGTPLTTNESSSNHHHHGGSGGFIYPKLLSDSERATAALLLDGLSDDIAQALLDELAGRIAAGGVRSSRLGYLRSLVTRAREGAFVPELALVVAAQRQKRAAEKKADSQAAKPASKEVVEAGLKAMRSIVGRGACHGR